MKKQMLKLKWIALLFVSSLVLIWRLMDFAYEAANGGFHITRCGFALKGADAEAIQLFIILASIALVWKVITNLVHLKLTDSSRWHIASTRHNI